MFFGIVYFFIRKIIFYFNLPILIVGTEKLHIIIISVCPSNCFIFHNISSLSDIYDTVPFAVLNVAFCKSFGTGTYISTFVAIDRFLKFVLALTVYSNLVEDSLSTFTSTQIKGFS